MNPASQSSAADTAASFPFELSIKRLGHHTDTEQVLCRKHLRVLPGKREVFDALWNGREVIVKVFLKKLGAGHRLKREWNGLCMLRNRGVNAPEPLFYGQTEDGRLTVVSEKVGDVPTLIEVFDGASGEERIKLLTKVSSELAKQIRRLLAKKTPKTLEKLVLEIPLEEIQKFIPSGRGAVNSAVRR